MVKSSQPKVLWLSRSKLACGAGDAAKRTPAPQQTRPHKPRNCARIVRESHKALSPGRGGLLPCRHAAKPLPAGRGIQRVRRGANGTGLMRVQNIWL